MILQHFDQWLPAQNRRIGPLGQLDIHMSSQPVYFVDVAFLELTLLEVICILYNL